LKTGFGPDDRPGHLGREDAQAGTQNGADAEGQRVVRLNRYGPTEDQQRLRSDRVGAEPGSGPHTAPGGERANAWRARTDNACLRQR
jgi:hypothetical protein